MTSAPSCVLLTATIAPGEVAFTARSDPRVRMDDYLWALRFWLASTDVPALVFCENSGHDLAPVRALVGREGRPGQEVEVLSFHGQDFDPRRGKGVGEMRAIGHALAQSRLLRSSTRIVKVSGRYRSTSYPALVAQAEAAPHPQVICDLTEGMTAADGRVFLASRDFLERYLLPRQDEIDDQRGAYFEHALAKAFHRAMSEGIGCTIPAHAIDVQGISGSSGVPFRSGGLHRAVRGILQRAKFRLFAR